MLSYLSVIRHSHKNTHILEKHLSLFFFYNPKYPPIYIADRFQQNQISSLFPSPWLDVSFFLSLLLCCVLLPIKAMIFYFFLSLLPCFWPMGRGRDFKELFFSFFILRRTVQFCLQSGEGEVKGSAIGTCTLFEIQDETAHVNIIVHVHLWPLTLVRLDKCV